LHHRASGDASVGPASRRLHLHHHFLKFNDEVSIQSPLSFCCQVTQDDKHA
jgi:hypothetical protein